MTFTVSQGLGLRLRSEVPCWERVSSQFWSVPEIQDLIHCKCSLSAVRQSKQNRDFWLNFQELITPVDTRPGSPCSGLSAWKVWNWDVKNSSISKLVHLVRDHLVSLIFDRSTHLQTGYLIFISNIKTVNGKKNPTCLWFPQTPRSNSRFLHYKPFSLGSSEKSFLKGF